MLKIASKQKIIHGPKPFTNLRLEQETLGHCLWLVDKDFQEEAYNIALMISRQDPDLFTLESHQALAKALCELAQPGKQLSEGILQQALMNQGTWSDDEDDLHKVTSSMLAELLELGSLRFVMVTNMDPQLIVSENLRELSELRRKRLVLHKYDYIRMMLEDWHPGNEVTIGEALDDLSRAFHQRTSQKETAGTLKMLIERERKSIELESQGLGQTRIRTGFEGIDFFTGGFEPGNLICLAGRSGMGKTALALDISLSVAKSENIVVFFSFEMTRSEITRRIISKQTGIDSRKLRNGDLDDSERKRIAELQPDLFPLIDKGNYTPLLLEQRLTHFESLLGVPVDFIVVDHLTIMGTADKTRYDNKHRQLAEYTGQLKRIAKERGCVILALAQLNRGVEHRTLDQRLPRLSDIRESGSIEENSDVVFGLYRAYPDTKKTEDFKDATIRILKNRSGPIGDIDLKWIAETQTFESVN